MRPLPRPLQALITWVAILPLVLIFSMLAVPVTVGWPDPLRTAFVITVVVPLAVFWAVPMLARLTQRFRGVPSTVVSASCPASGVRGLGSEASQSVCSTEGTGYEAAGVAATDAEAQK